VRSRRLRLRLDPPEAGWEILFLVALFTGSSVLKLVSAGVPSFGELAAAAALLLGGLVVWSNLVRFNPGGLERWLWRRRIVVACLLAAASVGVGAAWAVYETSPPAYRFRGELEPVGRTAADAGDSLPNVIVMSVDTLRLDAVPPHVPGEDLPHLQGLLDDSVRFTRHYSTSSWTLPAHASLLTGQRPLRHGAVESDWGAIPIDPQLATFPQYLGEVGYRTAGFVGGSYVRRELGMARGFDRWAEYPFEGTRPYRDFLPGVVEGLLEVLGGASAKPGPLRVRPDPPAWNPRKFSRTVDESTRWMARRATGSDSPFFLFLHTYHVHDWPRRFSGGLERLGDERPDLAASLRPPSRARKAGDTRGRILLADVLDSGAGSMFMSAFQNPLFSYDLPEDARTGFARHPVGTIRDREDLTRAEADRLRALLRRQYRAKRRIYAYGVEGFDRALGDFLRFLKERGLYRSSLIVLLSDHGEGFSLNPLIVRHGRRGFVDGRGQLHDALVRTPLWVKLPDHQRRGETVSIPVTIREVFPMILDHLGVRGLPDAMSDPGVSLSRSRSTGRRPLPGVNSRRPALRCTARSIV